jgi:hypothetical protein
MLERVKWQKYLSSFINAYAEMYDEDHRVHTNFKLIGTVTGRLSSGKTDDDKITGVRGKTRGVNLQQVPRDKLIRGLFGAAPGLDLRRGRLLPDRAADRRVHRPRREHAAFVQRRG